MASDTVLSIKTVEEDPFNEDEVGGEFGTTKTYKLRNILNPIRLSVAPVYSRENILGLLI